MPRCETCRFWVFDQPDWEFDELRFGECKRVKMREQIWEEALAGTEVERFSPEGEVLVEAALLRAKAIAIDGSGYYAGLRTQPDFGCVLHEPKEHQP